MLSITSKSPYALRALTELADRDGAGVAATSPSSSSSSSSRSCAARASCAPSAG